MTKKSIALINIITLVFQILILGVFFTLVPKTQAAQEFCLIDCDDCMPICGKIPWWGCPLPEPEPEPICGNGSLEGDEVCDYEGIIDGKKCLDCQEEVDAQPEDYDNQEDCQGAGYYWYNDACHAEPEEPEPEPEPICGNEILEKDELCDYKGVIDGQKCLDCQEEVAAQPEDYDNQEDCQGAAYYWYNDACHAEPEEEEPEEPEPEPEPTPSSNGGGGGGGPVLGLTIYNETAIPTANSVIITWLTNKLANSRVIYDIILHPSLGNPPNYSYAHSTPEYDQDPKITFHTVAIDGLLAGTQYFWRAVSQASPEKVGQEFSFTTLEAEEVEEIEEVEIPEEGEVELEGEIILPAGPEVSPEVDLIREGPIGEKAEEITEEVEEEKEEEKEKEEIVISPEEEEGPAQPGFPTRLLAGIGGLVTSFGGWMIILGVVLLAWSILIFLRKRKEENKIS